MADNLDDGEFWLPPQFLSDENDKSFDQKMIKHNNSFFGVRNDDIFNSISRSFIPYLSSSSETDSEEEEHIAELTRQFALSTLEVDLNSEKPKPKDVIGGGSPQSTLSALESSGKGSSPDGAVLDVNSQNETFDLLSAAAGEMEKMRLNENNVFGNGSVCTNNNNSSKSNQPKPSPVNVNNHSKSNKPKPTPVNFNVNAAGVGLSFYPQPQPLQQQMQQPSLSQQQLQVAQFGMMRPVQRVMQRQMVPNRGRNKNNMNIINNHNNVGRGLSGPAWPPLQNGGGMRAVFIPGNRESAGTGVFLPRSVETRNQPRKKSVCKTALVPARVMQALNMKKSVVAAGNLQQQHHNQQPQCFNGGNGSAVARGCGNNNKNNQNNYGVSLQKVNKVNPPQAQVVNQEIQLPQEWTY